MTKRRKGVSKMMAFAAASLAACVAVAGEGGAKPRVWPSNDATVWEPLKIMVTSTLDGTEQPAYFRVPDTAPKGVKVPLLVALHSWSYGYTCLDLAAWGLNECEKRGWAFLHPHFRGPNNNPDACGSDKAVQDIVDQVRWAIANHPIDPDRVYLIGGSGGGHMALLMAGRHPELWAGVYAACPPADLARWHAQCVKPDSGVTEYARMMATACGGTPQEKPEEYAHRSATTHLSKAAGVPVDICTGVHDGHRFRNQNHSVLPSQSIRCFNILADATARISEADMDAIDSNEAVPEALRYDGKVPYFSDGSVLLRRQSNNVRLTLHNGGHAGNYAAGIAWLARQRRSAVAEWYEPEGGTGALHSITK